MVLYTINSIANKYQKQVEPLLSLTVDFYIRLFIRIKDSPISCHYSITNYSHVFQCQDCESFYLQPYGQVKTEPFSMKGAKRKLKESAKQEEVKEEEPKGATDESRDKFKVAALEVPSECGSCGGRLQMGGPIWNKHIHNLNFVRQLHASAEQSEDFKTKDRIVSYLAGIVNEGFVGNQPLSFDLQMIASSIRSTNPTK